MKELLIVWHSQFGGTAQMAAAVRDGASGVPDVTITHVEARHVCIPTERDRGFRRMMTVESDDVDR